MEDSLRGAAVFAGAMIESQIGGFIGGQKGARIGLVVGTFGGLAAGNLAVTLGGQCFPTSTPILRPDGGTTPIGDIAVGDHVMAFDRFGALEPRKVVRLYRNVMTEWLEIAFRYVCGSGLTASSRSG